MDNDQLTALKQHSRDSEQMANLLKSIEDSESDDNGFADMFNEFREDIHKEFEEFCRKNNEEYAEFVKSAWATVGKHPAVKPPEEPKPPVAPSLAAMTKSSPYSSLSFGSSFFTQKTPDLPTISPMNRTLIPIRHKIPFYL